MTAPEGKKKIFFISMTGVRMIESASLGKNYYLSMAPEFQEQVRAMAQEEGVSEESIILTYLKMRLEEKEKKW